MTEVRQEGRGELFIENNIPAELTPLLLPHSTAQIIRGHGFYTLMQEFRGEDFSAWFNRMLVEQRTVITIEADLPTLELRIALKNRIRGTIDRTTEGDLLPHFFQMAFVPTIDTRAIFDHAAEYLTFDIHLRLSFLESIGVSYKLLDRFMEKVVKGTEPAELVCTPYACTTEMLQLVDIILTSEHSPAGHGRMLRNHITSIVIAALEVVSRKEGVRLTLTKADRAALHEIREMIFEHKPQQFSNDELLAKVFPRLNAFKLGFGFKRMFGMHPREYAQRLRFDVAKDMLAKGASVDEVSWKVGYQSATGFIAAFKERFGITPKQWTKR